jgi:hypothetical protein
LQTTAEAETDVPERRKIFAKVSKLKLQQLNLLRQLTTMMEKVEPSSNFELVQMLSNFFPCNLRKGQITWNLYYKAFLDL